MDHFLGSRPSPPQRNDERFRHYRSGLLPLAERSRGPPDRAAGKRRYSGPPTQHSVVVSLLGPLLSHQVPPTPVADVQQPTIHRRLLLPYSARGTRSNHPPPGEMVGGS